MLILDLLRESGRIMITLYYLTVQTCHPLIFTLDLERICIVKNEEYSSIRLLENNFLLVSPSDIGCILTLLNATKC